MMLRRDTRGPAMRSVLRHRSHGLAHDQQKAAVRQVLSCKDTVNGDHRRAGRASIVPMEEAAEAVRGHGKEVFVFAPSTGAREVLQQKGFDRAETVEHLLRNEKLTQN
jgi:hypothetical protein